MVAFAYPWVLLLIPLVMLFWLLGFLEIKFEKRRARRIGLDQWYGPAFSRVPRLLIHFCDLGWKFAAVAGLAGLSLWLSPRHPPLNDSGRVYIVDVSRSMTAEEDVFGLGGRLGAAKREIAADIGWFISQDARMLTGIVLFAGNTRQSIVLNENPAQTLSQIMSAEIFSREDQGTNYVEALSAGLQMCQRAKVEHCFAVLITDGDRAGLPPDHEAILFSKILPEFRHKRVRLDVIGVGRREAELPPSESYGRPMKRSGPHLVPTTSMFDAVFLKRIAEAGGGEFFVAGERGATQRHLGATRKTAEKIVAQSMRTWIEVSEYCYMVSALLLGCHLWLLVSKKQN